MNILYIGSSGALSLAPFKALLAISHTIAAVGVHRPVIFRDKIIALENEPLSLAANHHAIPLIDLSQPIEDSVALCKRLSIDLILMSCYSKRLPAELIDLPANGCFNMHPSLLPLHRGSEPIFWQLQQASETGVSWHHVTDDFDAGDIVAQKKVYLDDGMRYAQINQMLATAGAELMLRLLDDISGNRLISRAQDATLANYQSYPAERDFVIDTAWTAQQAYNFICATRDFGHAYRCQLYSGTYLLDEALDYDNNSSLEVAEVQGDRLYIPCSEGVLIATFTAKL